jgi:CubicO group peptidase (beta-lactamase class C family)
MTIIDRREFALSLLAPLLVPRMSPSFSRLLPAPPATAAINPPSADFLARLPEIMEIAGVPGLSMSVVQDGRIAWSHYRGVMDASTNQPVAADTLWPAASLSKPAFALAALHLVDEGKLDLDRPLKSYVPDHAPDDPRGNKITARHVLSHSSGLRNWRNRPDQPLVPDFEPGARFQYSGEGIYYLQRAVEHITGIGFEQFMEERLFNPLGMKSSTYSWRRDVPGRLVAGHDQGQPRQSPSKDLAQRLLDLAEQQKKPLAAFKHEDLVIALQSMSPAPPTLPNSMIPNAAATLLTTPTDYGTFLTELLENHNAAVDLKPETRKLMTTQQSRINSALAWGLGIGLERQADAAGDPNFLWHWGDNGAWKNFVLAHAGTKSAIVVFTNGSRGLNVAQRIITAATGQAHAAFLWL